jgi:hypothetical protein
MRAFLLLPLQIVIGTVIAIGTCETIKLPEYLELKDIAIPIINKLIRRK